EMPKKAVTHAAAAQEETRRHGRQIVLEGMHDRFGHEVRHRTKHIMQISLQLLGLLDRAVEKIQTELRAWDAFRRPSLEERMPQPAFQERFEAAPLDGVLA